MGLHRPPVDQPADPRVVALAAGVVGAGLLVALCAEGHVAIAAVIVAAVGAAFVFLLWAARRAARRRG